MPATLPSLDVSWPVYVILPMIGAIVPIWFRRDRVKAGWGAAAILFLTTLHVLAFGQDLDTLSFIMALFIPAIGTVNLVYAVGYMEHSHTQWRFYAFFLLMTGGLLGVAASSDLFSFFTFWEIMSSWALYFAIAHEGTPEALREGFKYFLFNVAGAGFLFLGIGLIVAYTGTGEFAGVAKGFASLSPAVGTSIMILMAVGFCMKAAQVSLRIDWQMHPALAPTPVSGYISSVLLKIAVFRPREAVPRLRERIRSVPGHGGVLLAAGRHVRHGHGCGAFTLRTAPCRPCSRTASSWCSSGLR